MYVSTAWSKVYALDAATGRQIWYYDPKVPGLTGAHACCDVVNRGVAVYEGKVYIASLDGRLIALDAASGKPVWSVRMFEYPESGLLEYRRAAGGTRQDLHRQRGLGFRRTWFCLRLRCAHRQARVALLHRSR